MRDPDALVHGFSFSGHAGAIAAHAEEEVLPALLRVEAAVQGGLHAVGFLSYDAAPGLNPDLTAQRQEDFPLLRFDLYRNRRSSPSPTGSGSHATSDWSPTVSETEYLAKVAEIRELIEAGDCYQVNFTLAERFQFNGDPCSFFRSLARSQPTPFAAYFQAGRYRILSASPELFFSLNGDRLTTKPMKGTASRGRWSQEDRQAKQDLLLNQKERAENLMIVDLLRNDLGIVSETGSVEVPSLFDVETLPTVHQMTSTVTSRLRKGATLTDVLKALFPCGSITGAPKRRSMEIIAELEPEPRGLYTGCIGYVSPGAEVSFSVAIRTAVIDMETGSGRLGIGSGITHDSRGAAEYAECLAKGAFARKAPLDLDFHLIESLLHEKDGYFLLERHLNRLEESAAYFGIPFSRLETRQLLEEQARPLEGQHKVRLLLFPDGQLRWEATPLHQTATGPNGIREVPVGIARHNVDAGNRLLYHKTSLRDLYRKELALRPDCSEVIFANDRGEVTEGTYTNVVARIGGAMVTPPLSCGLLPGVFREELLERGEITERPLSLTELREAEELYVINSVRRWQRAVLID